jgi:ketosteroid isomerase-like protein
MATPSELLDANLLAVFNNRDPASRRAAIDETYTDDVAFTDPDGTVIGRSALDERAAAVLAGSPEEFVFTAEGLRYTSSDSGALAWAFGPSGAPVVRGIDVITVRDGRIATLRTILNG